MHSDESKQLGVDFSSSFITFHHRLVFFLPGMNGDEQ